MQKIRRPKTIILLLVLSIYFFLRGIGRLFLFSSNPDYYVFSQAGVVFLFFILSIPMLIISGITIQYLWRPKPIGLWIALSGQALGLVDTLIIFFITLNNPEIIREALILYREARGLPMRPEVINYMLSSTGIIVTFGISFGSILLVTALLLWKKDYFLQEGGTRLLEPNPYM